MMPYRLPVFALPALMACGSPDTKIIALTPDIVVAPEEVAFGDIAKLYTVQSEVQILNSGRAPLEISDIELEVAGGYADVFSIDMEADDSDGLFATVAAGDTLPLSLGFRPHKYMDYRARILVHSDDADQPVLAVPVTGTGVVAPTPDINLSPLSVDFGTVPRNETETAYFAIQNVGDGPLDILGVDLDESPFNIIADPSGQTIAATSEFTVVAEYTPDDEEPGHAADLIIRSTDPDEPEVTVVLLGGNGGEDYQPPIAKIDCDALQRISPPTTVALRAPDSDDPEDEDDIHPLSYEWELIGRPDLSRTYIMNPSKEEPDLFIDVAGAYQIQLIVTDFNGVSSAPDVCTANVVPEEALYVALSWDTNNADLDLHLVPSGSLVWGPSTCFFCCPVPTWPILWGAPVYTLDNVVGYGPESINVAIPGDEIDYYYIRVQYFSDRGGGETEATVSIYIDGALAENRSITFTEDEHLWKVGKVSFNGPASDETRIGTFIEENTIEYFENKNCPECAWPL